MSEFWARLVASRWARLGAQVAVVLVVIAALGVGAWAFYRAQESRGRAALAAASALLPADDQPLRADDRERAITAFEGVLAEYPRLSVAPQAAYELGNLKFASNQYGAARAAYAVALAKGATGTLATLAQIGIGYAWEAEKKYADAAAAYAATVKQLGPKDFLFEEALMSEARAEELGGKPAVAIDVYQRLLRDVPDSRHAQDLRGRIATLQSRPQQP